MFQEVRRGKGFALIKVLVVIAIVIILGSLVYKYLTSRGAITGIFTTAPDSITADSAYILTYKVTKSWSGKTKPLRGREISFRTSPGGDTIAVNPTTGTTDELGEIKVTARPYLNYSGGATIWAQDEKSGTVDDSVHFMVQDRWVKAEKEIVGPPPNNQRVFCHSSGFNYCKHSFYVYLFSNSDVDRAYRTTTWSRNQISCLTRSTQNYCRTNNWNYR